MDIRERYEEKLLDRFAAEVTEDEVLELCLSKAVQLASALDILKHTPAEERRGIEYEALIAPKVACMLVMLDVLQLQMGNVEESELEFFQKMELALEEAKKSGTPTD